VLSDGEDDFDENDDKFDAGDPGWQTIDVAEARGLSDGEDGLVGSLFTSPSLAAAFR